VLSAQEAPMTSRIRSKAASGITVGELFPIGLADAIVGVQRRSLSLARQCGRFEEGKGRRSG